MNPNMATEHAIFLNRTTVQTTAGLFVVVRTTWSTDLTQEVYTVDGQGREAFVCFLWAHPAAFEILAELDGARRGWTPTCGWRAASPLV